MREIHTCTTCGHSDHIENMWPECPCCAQNKETVERGNLAYEIGPPPFTGAIPSLCLERTARLFETPDYKQRVARLIFSLEEAIFEIAKISPNIKARSEAIITIRAALDLVP